MYKYYNRIVYLNIYVISIGRLYRLAYIYQVYYK